MSLDAMESGVLRPQSPGECVVDFSLQMPQFVSDTMTYDHKVLRDRMTYTHQERLTDTLSHLSVASTHSQSSMDVASSNISGSFALATIVSTTPSIFKSLAVSTDYSKKAINPNKLQSPDSANILQSEVSFNDKCRQKVSSSNPPKIEQCVVDIPLRNQKVGEIYKTYSTNMFTMPCNKFSAQNSFSKSLPQGSSMSQIYPDTSYISNEALPTTIFQVVSEVPSPDRKHDKVSKSPVLDGFAVVSSIETIPFVDTSLTSERCVKRSQGNSPTTSGTPRKEDIHKDVFVNVPEQDAADHRSCIIPENSKRGGTFQEGFSSTHTPQKQDIHRRSSKDGFANVLKPNGIIPENSKQDETFLEGFAAGLRSRNVHPPPHQEDLIGAHGGISVFNICETTYRSPLHEEPQYSFVEYTIDTQHKDLRVSKKQFPRSISHIGKKVVSIGLRVVFVSCVILGLFFLVHRPHNVLAILFLFVCLAVVSAFMQLFGIVSCSRNSEDEFEHFV